jgi:hypothetical protein
MQNKPHYAKFTKLCKILLIMQNLPNYANFPNFTKVINYAKFT